MNRTYIEQFKSARRAGVPIIIIRTIDPVATMRELNETFEELRKGKEQVAMLRWDVRQGVIPVSNKGPAADASSNAASMVNAPVEGDDPRPPALVTGNVIEALARSQENLPKDSVLFMLNPHILLEARDESRIGIIQAILNLREPFKVNKRNLVLLVPDIKVPIEMTNDVITLDAPLPDEDDLKQIVNKQFKNAQMTPPEDITQAVNAITGLSQFTAEQVVAMSLEPNGLNYESLWDRKISVMDQVGGLKVHRDTGISFDSIGGLENVKTILRRIRDGKRKPKVVVLFDEIEKSLGGQDSSGVQADALGQILTFMQDNMWSGVLLPGVPGTGKTELMNAFGMESEGLFVKFDLGATRDMWVGNSEKRIRAALNMLLAMGGQDVFIGATTNSIDAIKPELQSRFGYGTYFFDLPTVEERQPIWDIWMKKFKLTDDPSTVNATGWTGRNIMQICKLADEFGIKFTDAQRFITATGTAMGNRLDALRASAHGKYLSASNSGTYLAPAKPKAGLPKTGSN